MKDQDDAVVIESVRQFNRFYTKHIGILERRLWNSPYSLVQARVLYEIATRSSPTAGEIGDYLGMDAGHLSRIIQQFESSGLLSRLRSAADARRFDLKLTATGRRAFKTMDHASHKGTQQMLSELGSAQRAQLLGSMDSIRKLLKLPNDKPKAQVVLRDRLPGDLGWAIERHGALYSQEYGWNRDFDTFVANLFADFAAHHDATKERMWIAELDGARVGCAFVVKNKETTQVAQLRCLLVDPAARGHGVGKYLLDAALTFAREAGYDSMVLWTNDILLAARHLYETAGFSLVEESRHHSFGKDLVGQVWAKPLRVAPTTGSTSSPTEALKRKRR